MGRQTRAAIRPLRQRAGREVWMYVKDGPRLGRRRRARGISQSQLAALAKCTQQYVSLIERGVDTDVSERIALAICKWLDIELEDYFEERSVVVTPTVATSSRDGSAA